MREKVGRREGGSQKSRKMEGGREEKRKKREKVGDG